MPYQPPAAIQAALDAGRISEDAVDLFRAFARRYAFPLDDFQVAAILAILEGSSVIVSAPTGAGKTLVAEFAIHDALAAKRRVAYTTPLKALSNQKYADFCRQFGVAEVGILTGDVKVNSRAPVLVMTTEILRNMFYTGTLEGLRHVVLDECHYMGDEGRGTVWEEIIVNAPKDVTLVALSATVANVREIADWIGLVHRPIQAVVHPHRPVPLRYHVADLAAGIHPLEAVRSGRAKIVGIEGGAMRGAAASTPAGWRRPRRCSRSWKGAAGCPQSTSSSAAPGASGRWTTSSRRAARSSTAPAGERWSRRLPRPSTRAPRWPPLR